MNVFFYLTIIYLLSFIINVDANKIRKKAEKKWILNKLTWYNGNDLKNPACGGNDPNDNSYIVAVSEKDSPWKCGDKLKLINNGNNKSVNVKVVDYCKACESDPSKHIDATIGVYKELGIKLTLGEAKNVTVEKIN